MSLVQGSNLRCLKPKWNVHSVRASPRSQNLLERRPVPTSTFPWCCSVLQPPALLTPRGLFGGLTSEAPHCLYTWPLGGYRVQAGCIWGDALSVRMSPRAHVPFKFILR